MTEIKVIANKIKELASETKKMKEIYSGFEKDTGLNLCNDLTIHIYSDGAVFFEDLGRELGIEVVTEHWPNDETYSGKQTMFYDGVRILTLIDKEVANE